MRSTNRAWLVGDVAYIDVSTVTHPQAIASVDALDLDRVLDGNGRWRAWKPPTGTTLYVVRCGTTKNKRVYLHRFILGLSEGDPAFGDHRAHDGLDNRRSNLRVATARQNSANMRPRLGHSRYKGVYSTTSGRWSSQIKTLGVKHYLGTHDTEEDAARAYDAAARSIHGSFACTNFPQTQWYEAQAVEEQMDEAA